MLVYNHDNLKIGKKLRKKMTFEENLLWFQFLKDLPIKIYRQKLIGNYIVDFYCPDKKIAIEIDGGQHYEDKNITNDKERTEFLNSLGIEVLRYNNNDVKFYFDAVCDDLYNKLINK